VILEVAVGVGDVVLERVGVVRGRRGARRHQEFVMTVSGPSAAVGTSK
jgi:hypothetical protein